MPPLTTLEMVEISPLAKCPAPAPAPAPITGTVCMDTELRLFTTAPAGSAPAARQPSWGEEDYCDCRVTIIIDEAYLHASSGTGSSRIGG